MIFLGGKEIEQSQYLTIFELPELKVFTGFFEEKKLSPKIGRGPQLFGTACGDNCGQFQPPFGMKPI